MSETNPVKRRLMLPMVTTWWLRYEPQARTEPGKGNLIRKVDAPQNATRIID